MADDELIGRLEALGASQPDGLDDRRRDAIENRVTGVAGPGRSVTATRRHPVLMAAAAIVLVVAFGVVAAVLTSDGGPQIEAAAGTVLLELPGGETVRATPGAKLPEGTVIDVAPESSARIDGAVLGPGRYAMRDGRAVDLATGVAPTDRPRTSSPADHAPATTRPEGDLAPEPDAPTTTNRARPATTTARDEPDRHDRPLATDPPATDPARGPATTTTPATTLPTRTTLGTTTTAPSRDRTDRITTTLPADTTTSTATSVGDRPDERPRDG